MPDLSVRPAELEALLPVLRASANAFAARGLPMWSPETLTLERLSRQYPGAQAYLGHLDEQAVAAMLLVPEDRYYWPHDPPGEALYLHKLAVHPDWQGRAFGAAMIGAAVHITREAGRPWLRLDTAAERPKLRAIYERQGFRLVREGELHGWPAAWYERQVNLGELAHPT